MISITFEIVDFKGNAFYFIKTIIIFWGNIHSGTVLFNLYNSQQEELVHGLEITKIKLEYL